MKFFSLSRIKRKRIGLHKFQIIKKNENQKFIQQTAATKKKQKASCTQVDFVCSPKKKKKKISTTYFNKFIIGEDPLYTNFKVFFSLLCNCWGLKVVLTFNVQWLFESHARTYLFLFFVLFIELTWSRVNYWSGIFFLLYIISSNFRCLVCGVFSSMIISSLNFKKKIEW